MLGPSLGGCCCRELHVQVAGLLLLAMHGLPILRCCNGLDGAPHPPALCCCAPVPQVYYPVPNEVYRDEWDDVQVTDPMEFTHCRYTPVVTEVGMLCPAGSALLCGRLGGMQPSAAIFSADHPNAMHLFAVGVVPRPPPPPPRRMHATLAWTATRCACSAWTARSSSSSASPSTTRTMMSCARRLWASAT